MAHPELGQCADWLQRNNAGFEAAMAKGVGELVSVLDVSFAPRQRFHGAGR
jgi:hypothetical protein